MAVNIDPKQSNSKSQLSVQDSAPTEKFPTDKKATIASQIPLTNIEAQISHTTQASSMTFKPKIIDDKIDGKRFHTWGARVKTIEPEEVKQDWNSPTTNENSWPITKQLVKARSFINKHLTPAEDRSTLTTVGMYTLQALFPPTLIFHSIKGLSYGTEWAYKKAKPPVVNFHRRRWGFHNNLEYVRLKEEESIEVHKMLKEFWNKYKDEVDFKIDDVTSMYFKVPLTKEGKPDLNGKFTFIAEVKQKEKDGSYKKDKNGKIVIKRIEIVRGHFSDNNKKDECKDFLISLGEAVDFSSFPSRPGYTQEEFFDDLKKGNLSFFDPEDSKKTVESKSTESKKTTESSKVDPLICFAHAAKVLTDATKSKEEQETEFSKPKTTRDKEATQLRKDCFDQIGQQDVHEALIKSDLLGDLSRFSATTTYYIDKRSISSRDEQDPIPSIAIPSDKSLQTALDAHFDCSDIEQLSKWKDDRENSSTKGQEFQITRRQSIYEKKPPFLMIATKRYKAVTPTPIDDPLVVPDTLELKHIKGQNPASAPKYNIKGFIYHTLDSTQEGHYITYIQRQMPNPKGNGNVKKWFIYDNLGDFGIEISDSDTGFQQRKQKAYVYLYKDEESEK